MLESHWSCTFCTKKQENGHKIWMQMLSSVKELLIQRKTFALFYNIFEFICMLMCNFFYFFTRCPTTLPKSENLNLSHVTIPSFSAWLKTNFFHAQGKFHKFQSSNSASALASCAFQKSIKSLIACKLLSWAVLPIFLSFLRTSA